MARTYPVEEKTRSNTSPGEARVSLRLLDQIVDSSRLGLEPVAKDLALQGARVESILGWDEALHASSNRRIDERVL